MKTPREFLLARHETAVPRLDKIRSNIVDGINKAPRSVAWKLWEELILPVRRAWIGIAAAWVVVIALNLLAGSDSQPSVGNPGAITPDSVMALQRQEQLMAEAIETGSQPAKPPEDQPRSEADVRQKIV